MQDWKVRHTVIDGQRLYFDGTGARPVIWKLDQMVLTDYYHSWNLFILVKNKNRTMDYQAYPSYVKSAVYRPHFFYSY